MLERFARSLVVCLSVVLPCAAGAEFAFDLDEPSLFPAGLSSPDVLRTSEWQLAPHGWVAYGASEDLTLFWDWLLAFGKVPVGLVRYRFLGSQSSRFMGSFELHGMYFPESLDDKRIPQFAVRHGEGWQNYALLTGSWRVTRRMRLLLSTGATYSTLVEYEPYKRRYFEPKTYSRSWDPQAYGGVQVDVRRWLKVNAGFGAGNSLMFYDGIPHKALASMGINVTPFPREWFGLLSRLRVEFSGYLVRVPDTGYTIFFPPIFPVVYWQWGVD